LFLVYRKNLSEGQKKALAENPERKAKIIKNLITGSNIYNLKNN
jgi:hypothetical protein